MLAILSSLNAHSFPIFQPILMILVSKFMVHRALSDKTYLLLGLLSPLTLELLQPSAIYDACRLLKMVANLKTKGPEGPEALT